jgi:hypothetical protein
VTAIAHDTCSRRGRTVASQKVTGNDPASTMITWRGSPYRAAASIAASVRNPASAGGRTRPISVYSSPIATTPRAKMPSVQISPPWSTMISAKTIAGIATTIRGARSDPGPRSGLTAIA